MRPISVLVVEDSPPDALLLRSWLNGRGPGAYRCILAGSLGEAKAHLAATAFDVVLSDLGLPDSMGLETVSALLPCLDGAVLVVLTGDGDGDMACAALRAGAADVLVKGHVDGFIVDRAIHYALERRRLEEALAASERRFRDFARAASDWFWETGPDHRYSFVSDGVARVGIDPADLLGRPRHGLDQGDPTGAFSGLEVELPLAGGGTRHVSLSAVPVLDAAGHFMGHRGVGTDVTERRALQEEVARLALHDTLTGLPNRALFADLFRRAAAAADRRGEALALLFIDLDGFKPVNDRLGHAAGDAVLRLVATRLEGVLRAGDAAARLGGDEFVVLASLPSDAVAGRAAVLADRIVAALARPMPLEEGEVQVGASIGIAIAPAGTADLESCLLQADQAMYRAKKAGGAGWALASAGLDDTLPAAPAVKPSTVAMATQ